MSKLLDQVEKDLDVFMDSEMGFATPVTVGAVSFSAIFDRDYIEQSGEAIYVASSVPVLIAATHDVQNLNRGELVNGLPDSYKIKNFKPDQTGETVVYLELQ